MLSPTGRVLGKSSAASADVLANLSAARKPGYFGFKVNGASYRAHPLRWACASSTETRAMADCVARSPSSTPLPPTTCGTKRWKRSGFTSPLEHCCWQSPASRWYGFCAVDFPRCRNWPQSPAAFPTRSWEFVPPKAVLRTAELAPIAFSIEKLLDGLHESFERQRQLTGDAAHELKTSIAVLKSSLQLLAMSPRTTEQYEAGLEGLLIDTERMEDLASRMLALARLEEAPAETSEASELQSAVNAVADRLRPLAALKKVDLEVCAIDTGKVVMQADDADILCSNLIMNALQHSRPEGRISAVVKTENGVAELRVVDDGEGIPEAALPYVFDRFYRADRSRSRNSGGAGLGLSICKAIVERSNGTIQIKSAVGKGTEVWVVLPAVPAEL